MDGLYGHACPECGGLHNAVESSVVFDPEALSRGLKEIYDGLDVRNVIERFIFDETLRLFNEAAAKGIADSEYATVASDEFLRQIRTSNAVFSAFRVHRMQNDVARQLIDGNGRLKSFDRWMRDIEGITGHYVRNWLQSEYSTAVIRAHQAVDWKHFELEQDVLPNLRWMPTTSPNQDPLHRQYWEKRLTLPVGHPFWDEHRPGDRWNCKCTLMQTDEPANDELVRDLYPVPKQPGLDSNPAKDGKIFSDTHPYFTQAYPGAKEAVRQAVSAGRKKRRPEEAEDIRRRWVERKEIRRMARDWAKAVPEGAMKRDAEEAAQIVLRTFGKDYRLPRVNVSNLGGKTRRGLVMANYSAGSDTMNINSNKAAIKDYAEQSRNAVEWGWSSQKNSILHELSHQIHSKFDGRYSSRSLQTVELDRKYVKTKLSEYALTNKTEYEAELISGILSGKKYPDRIIAQSAFANDKGRFGKILVDKGRDMSASGIEARRTENKVLARELEEWYKAKMPATTIGSFPAKRFKVERMDGEEIVVNKTFYKEVIAKHKDDLFYSDRLDKARIAHNLIKDAKYIRTENPRHEKHTGEVFRIYERTYDDIAYELTVKVTSDEKFLYYIKRK